MSLDRRSGAPVGSIDPRFVAVENALAETIAFATEVGAALTVYVDKQCVVDLCAGHADSARTRPWARDTLVNLFSVGKAISAVCALRLVEAGGSSWTRPSRATGPNSRRRGRRRSPCATS